MEERHKHEGIHGKMRAGDEEKKLAADPNGYGEDGYRSRTEGPDACRDQREKKIEEDLDGKRPVRPVDAALPRKPGLQHQQMLYNDAKRGGEGCGVPAKCTGMSDEPVRRIEKKREYKEWIDPRPSGYIERLGQHGAVPFPEIRDRENVTGKKEEEADRYVTEGDAAKNRRMGVCPAEQEPDCVEEKYIESCEEAQGGQCVRCIGICLWRSRYDRHAGPLSLDDGSCWNDWEPRRISDDISSRPV